MGTLLSAVFVVVVVNLECSKKFIYKNKVYASFSACSLTPFSNAYHHLSKFVSNYKHPEPPQQGLSDDRFPVGVGFLLHFSLQMSSIILLFLASLVLKLVCIFIRF